jgi:primosomal protein N''
MEHLYLISKDIVYIRLQALVWYTNALSIENKYLEKANEALMHIIDQVETDKVLVINWVMQHLFCKFTSPRHHSCLS